jgi:hypothetical protein
MFRGALIYENRYPVRLSLPVEARLKDKEGNVLSRKNLVFQNGSVYGAFGIGLNMPSGVYVVELSTACGVEANFAVNFVNNVRYFSRCVRPDKNISIEDSNFVTRLVSGMKKDVVVVVTDPRLKQGAEFIRYAFERKGINAEVRLPNETPLGKFTEFTGEKYVPDYKVQKNLIVLGAPDSCSFTDVVFNRFGIIHFPKKNVSDLGLISGVAKLFSMHHDAIFITAWDENVINFAARQFANTFVR